MDEHARASRMRSATSRVRVDPRGGRGHPRRARSCSSSTTPTGRTKATSSWRPRHATPEAIELHGRPTGGASSACRAPAWRLDELEIPQMVTETTDGHEAAFTVSIDFRHGTSTGTSAARPGHHGASDHRPPTWSPHDFQKPGHVFPLRAKEGGVLRRAGHTEAAVDLADDGGALPGRRDLRGDERGRHDGAAARAGRASAREHELKLISIADLIEYRRRREVLVAQGGRGHDPDAVRRVPLLRVREPRSTVARTSRWCWATSATARRCSPGCTPSA